MYCRSREIGIASLEAAVSLAVLVGALSMATALGMHLHENNRMRGVFERQLVDLSFSPYELNESAELETRTVELASYLNELAESMEASLVDQELADSAYHLELTYAELNIDPSSGALGSEPYSVSPLEVTSASGSLYSGSSEALLNAFDSADEGFAIAGGGLGDLYLPRSVVVGGRFRYESQNPFVRVMLSTLGLESISEFVRVVPLRGQVR